MKEEMNGGIMALLTVKEAAKLCKVSTRTLYRFMQDERFPHPIKLNRGRRGSLRFRPEELQGYWDSQRVE